MQIHPAMPAIVMCAVLITANACSHGRGTPPETRPSSDVVAAVATTTRPGAGQLEVQPYVCEAVPLREVVADISRRFQVRVEWDELRAVGIDENSPVTMRVERGTLAKVLAGLRESLGAERIDWGWEGSSHVFLTSSPAHVRHHGLTCEYDVANLHFPDVDAAERELLMVEIAMLIMDSIEPDSWAAENRAIVERLSASEGKGPVTAPKPVPDSAYITWTGARMTIRQTPRSQREIVEMFDRLRETSEIPFRMRIERRAQQ